MHFLPNFKGFDLFPHHLRIDFMRFKGLCLVLSIIGMLISLALFFTLGLNYGVDFKGGSMIEVQSKSGPADIAALRDKLGKVENRALHSATEQQNSGGALKGHVYILRYETRFERGEGMETFTLVELDGRWLLARYFVNSTALQ